MAKILIAYAGVNGMTKECAERLARELNGRGTELCDLLREKPDRTAADVVVVGACVRHGKLLPQAKAFLSELAGDTEERRIGVFLCCGFSDRFEEYKERLIPEAVRNRAFLISDFGGSLDPAGKPFWDRIWLFFARQGVVESEIEDGEYTPVLPGMNPENIGKMASYVREQLMRSQSRKTGDNAQ